MKVGLMEQADCLGREVRRRRKVLPMLVEQGRMTTEQCTAEIARMDAARQTLTQLAGMLGAKEEGRRVSPPP